MNKLLCLLASSFLSLGTLWGIDWPQWRGADRSGVSQETGLLKSWPSAGPKLLWEGGAVGEGFSSVAVFNGRIFTMGDKAGQSYLFCLNAKGGATLWSLKVGKSGGNYSGTRCTPTVDGDLVFALGQFGDLVCVEVASGQERWRKNLANDFGGSSGGWNYSESVLVDGNNLICSPGGNQATALALNKRTGSTVWKTVLSGGGESHYSSWVISTAAGIKQYVRLFAGGTFGVAADNGRFLWRYDKLGRNTANIPTPIPFGDFVFTTAGYSKGGALLKLSRSARGLSAEEVYFSRELKNKHGGIVKVGNYVYGDFDDRGSPWCADVRTGQVKWRRDSEGQGSGSACVTYADGCLYVRYQDGIMALVDASPQGGFRQISSFKIPDGMKKSWAHPVVCGGLLYLRGKDKILCYEVSDSKREAAPAQSVRLWTDDTGNFQVKAVFKGVKEGRVILEQADGAILKVPFDRLSPSDQNYLRGL